MLKGDGNAVPIIAVDVPRCKVHVGVRHGEGFLQVAVARVDEGLRLVVGIKAGIFLIGPIGAVRHLTPPSFCGG